MQTVLKSFKFTLVTKGGLAYSYNPALAANYASLPHTLIRTQYIGPIPPHEPEKNCNFKINIFFS